MEDRSCCLIYVLYINTVSALLKKHERWNKYICIKVIRYMSLWWLQRKYVFFPSHGKDLLLEVFQDFQRL